MSSADDCDCEDGEYFDAIQDQDESESTRDPFNNQVIVDKLVEYISPYDLNCCRQVSHLWRKLFSYTHNFLSHFRLRLGLPSLQELTDLKDHKGTFLICEIPWKFLVFEDEPLTQAQTQKEGKGCEIEIILSQFCLEELNEITIKGWNPTYQNICNRIISTTNNLACLKLDWLLLAKGTLYLKRSKSNENPFPNLSKLQFDSSQKKSQGTKMVDKILSHNLRSIFSPLNGLKCLSLLGGFSKFRRMKRTGASLKEIVSRNQKSLFDLILDEEFFECLAYWPRLGNLKTFGVTLSSWDEQKFQLKVYMKYLVGQLREFQFQSPYTDSQTNVFDLPGDGLSPMLVDYGKNLETLKLRSRVHIENFPNDVAFIRNLRHLKTLYFSAESPSHALLSYFAPGDELVGGLPLHLERLYLRGFSIRSPFLMTQMDRLTELCLNECKVRMEFFLVSILKGASEGGLVHLRVLELWDYQRSHGPGDFHFIGVSTASISDAAGKTPNAAATELARSNPNESWSITNLKELQKLTLRRFENITDIICVHGIRLLPSLTFLDLGFCESITPVGIEAVIRGCLYLQEVYVDDELELWSLNKLREGRPVKVYGISCAPVVVGNFIHNLLERIVELSSGI